MSKTFQMILKKELDGNNGKIPFSFVQHMADIGETKFVQLTPNMRVCVITLTTGHEVIGVAQVLDAKNDVEEIGNSVAYENAVNELWKLEGYLLKQKIYNGNIKTSNMNFGQAISDMKKGKKVARSGWNGKGMFIYYVPANKYPMSGNTLETMKGIYPDDLVPYQEYTAMKTVDNTVVPWLCSQSDMYAEDWGIVE